MPITKEVLEASKIKEDQEFGERVKYPLAVKWNKFVRYMQQARDEWTKLQEEMDGVDRRRLEDYPVVAQKHLGRFRGVKFEWMAGMFTDYYRGAGGLDDMHIILPPEPKKEKSDARSKKD